MHVYMLLELKKLQVSLKVEFNFMLKSFQDKTRIESSSIFGNAIQ